MILIQNFGYDVFSFSELKVIKNIKLDLTKEIRDFQFFENMNRIILSNSADEVKIIDTNS